jgi:hypothetical protein
MAPALSEAAAGIFDPLRPGLLRVASGYWARVEAPRQECRAHGETAAVRRASVASPSAVAARADLAGLTLRRGGLRYGSVLTSAWTSDPLLGPCRNPFRDRLGGLDVQEVTDVGDDFQRVRGGEPMPVVDLRGEDAAVVGTVELQQGRRDRLR